MKNDAGGSIINITSAVGRLPGRGFGMYGTAKAALAHYTRPAALDLNPQNPSQRHRAGCHRHLRPGGGGRR